MSRLIDADVLKKDLSRFYDGEVTAKQLIDEQATVGGWISVKDRMPEIGDTVLFTGLSSFGTRFIPQRGWFDGTFWKRETGETVYSSTPVTHWMPLPSTEELDET